MPRATGCKTWRLGALEVEIEWASGIGEKSLYFAWQPQRARDFRDAMNWLHRGYLPNKMKDHMRSEGWSEERIGRTCLLLWPDGRA